MLNMNKLEKPEIKEKPWGREVWFAWTDKYAGKILEFKKGEQCSYQYHERKEETLYVLEGKALFVVDGKEKEVGEGESIHFEPGTKHRLKALTDVKVFEVSTPELDDVVRLEDKYGRV